VTRRRLSIFGLSLALWAFAVSLMACQAMAPGTFSAKSGTSSEESPSAPKTDDELSPPPALPPEGAGPGSSPTKSPAVGDVPGPVPISAPATPPPPSGGPEPMPISAPPAVPSPTGGLGPLAKADDPMGPRSDKEGAGVCGTTLAAKETRFLIGGDKSKPVSQDEGNPTRMEINSGESFQGQFLAEANASCLSDEEGCYQWTDRLEGYARVIVTSSPGEASYIDLPVVLKIEMIPSGMMDYIQKRYNVSVEGLPVGWGATFKFYYYHLFGFTNKDVLTGIEECLLRAIPPPDYSPTLAPYTKTVQDHFKLEMDKEAKVVFPLGFISVSTLVPVTKPPPPGLMDTFRGL